MERNLIVDGDFLSEKAPSPTWERILNVQLGLVDMEREKLVLVRHPITGFLPRPGKFVDGFKKDERLPNLAIANFLESNMDMIPDDWKEIEAPIVFMGTVLVSNHGIGSENFATLSFYGGKKPYFFFSNDLVYQDVEYYAVHFA